MSDDDQQLEWFRVVDADELPSGRVMTVTAGTRSMALTNIDGEFTAMVTAVHTRAEQLETALTEAIAHQGPALVEIITDGGLIWPLAVAHHRNPLCPSREKRYTSFRRHR